jgi:Circadian oscillating protein COP23
MNKYFKFPAESNLGIGVQYIEFNDKGWAVRQAECYGDKWFNSNKSYHEELTSSSLCDQKLTESGIKLGDPVDAQEFEDIWNLSNKLLIPPKPKDNTKKTLVWIFPFASAVCFAFLFSGLGALLMGRVIPSNLVIGGSSNNNIPMSNIPPTLVSQDKEPINFVCTKYKNGFIIIGKVGNVEKPFLKISDSQKNWGENYSPQARCQIIKDKLNFYAEKQQPLTITLGAANGYDTACFSKGYGKGCINDEDRGQMLTLGRSSTNPEVRFNSLMAYFSDPNISSDYRKQQGKIVRDSSTPHYIYIDLHKFVKNEKNYYEFINE